MSQSNRLVLPATCRLHGTAGFTNLLVEPVGNGDRIRLDPHVTGACEISLERQAVVRLVAQLTEWL